MAAVTFPGGWWHPGPALAVTALEVDGRILIATAGDDATVRLWDPTTGEPFRTLEGHSAEVRALAALPMGDRTLLASAGSDGTVRVWEPTTGHPTRTLDGHSGRVEALVALRVEGRRPLLASAGDDGTVRLWEPADGGDAGIMEGHTGAVQALAVAAVDGHILLASAGEDTTVRLWDPADGGDAGILEGHGSAVRALVALPIGDRTLLASADDDATVRLWDPTTDRPIYTLRGHSSAVGALAALPMGDRTLLASADDGGTVRLWDVTTGQTVHIVEGDTVAVQALAVAAVDGRTVLARVGRDGRVELTPVDELLTEAEPLDPGPVKAEAAPGPGPVKAAAPPDPGPVKAAADQDRGPVTAAAAPAPGSSTRQEQTPTLHDRPAQEDLLERLPLAVDLDGRLTAYIDKAEAAEPEPDHAPFAVHVQGPWGSGKTSLVNLMVNARATGRAPWLVVRYDAWRESRVGPPWWSLARTMRSGIGRSRSPVFRLLAFRLLDAWSRAIRTPSRLVIVVVVLGLIVVSVGGMDFVGQAGEWWGAVTFAVPLALLADKFLFWDSAMGARLHVRSDNNPLGDVAAHVAWLRRWSARLPLDSVQPMACRTAAILVLAVAVRLGARAQAPPRLPDLTGAVAWLIPFALGLVVATVAAVDVVSRRRRLDPSPPSRRASRTARPGTTRSARRGHDIAVIVLGGVLVAAALLVPLPVEGPNLIVAWAMLAIAAAAVGCWAVLLTRRWLAGEKRPVLFVIDDLDRCTAAAVVEVLEAVQTIMREDVAPGARWRAPAPLVFLALADGRWLRAAFEEHYASFVDGIEEPGHSLGHLFLDKLFQLTVSIPPVPADDFRRYVEHLLARPEGERQAAEHPEHSSRRGRGRRAPGRDHRPQTGRPGHGATAGDDRAEGGGATRDRSREKELEAAARRQVLKTADLHELYGEERADRRLDEAGLSGQAQRRLRAAMVRKSLELEAKTAGHLLAAYHPLLPRNPRAVKRYINAYGVNATIAYGCLHVPHNADNADRLARWTLIAMRWPELGEALRRSPELIDVERAVADGGGASARVEGLLRDAAFEQVRDWKGQTLNAEDIRLFTGAPASGSADGLRVPAGGDATGPG